MIFKIRFWFVVGGEEETTLDVYNKLSSIMPLMDTTVL
jgi:hypothetical protein